MKNNFVKLLVFLAVTSLAVSCGNRGAGKSGKEEQAGTEAQRDTVKITAMEPMFDIVTNLGTIRVKLYEKTPKHRDNFCKLAREGFYNGILFHRVIDGFMIQAGDPLTKDPANADRFGTGGPGYNVPAEFVPEYRHIKGALAAARRGDAANPMRESSGSQFYIVQDERNCAQLDGQYTVFGCTVSGMEVIDAIAAVQTNYRDCPVQPVRIEEVKYVEEASLSEEQ